MHVSELGELPAAAPNASAPDPAEADAALINRALERLILAAPGQYLWGYHRYKRPKAPRPGQAAE